MQFCIINLQHPSHDCFREKWFVQTRGIAACTAHTIYWHSSVVVQTMASRKVLHINESCLKKKLNAHQFSVMIISELQNKYNLFCSNLCTEVLGFVLCLFLSFLQTKKGFMHDSCLQLVEPV